VAGAGVIIALGAERMPPGAALDVFAGLEGPRPVSVVALAVLLAVQQFYSVKVKKIGQKITSPALAAYECR
jgi:hypothetical protein